MEELTPPLSPEALAVKAAYEALNRNDIPGFLESFDPQIERIEPADFPGGGIYHGLEAVREHVTFHRGNWAEGGCTPQRLVIEGDRVVALVHVRVRLKGETTWREGDVGDVFTFRNGKVIQFRTFFDTREALEYAGVTSSKSSSPNTDR